MAYKPKVGSIMAAPNVIPMADIMLVLLIIMMVITPMLNNHQLVDMAKAKNWENMPAAERDDAVVVAVTRDGRFYLGNNEIALNTITSTVEDKISNKLDKTVYVRADENAKYGDVKKVVDAVRDAGVDNVGLLTLKDESGAPPPPPTPGGTP
ncbi:MAG: biopolymer transporter ExbD [Candidatus Acidiferrales bacterium]